VNGGTIYKVVLSLRILNHQGHEGTRRKLLGKLSRYFISQELKANLCLVRKPLVLIILDGWGYRAETKANAIALARKPIYDRLLREYPNTLIHTSGPFVGLPEGQMGNSEVGHLNIGAGASCT